MALQPQMIPIPLAQGVDTKDDPKQVPLGKLLTLENGFFQTPGEIRKQPGYVALSQQAFTTPGGSTTSAISNGGSLAAYANELTLGDGTKLYSYDPGISKWSRPGTYDLYVPLKATTAPISVLNQNTTPNQTYQDGAYDPVSGLQCFVWLTATSGYYSVIDKSSGQKIVDARPINTESAMASVKVVLFQSQFVIFYNNTAGANLNYIAYPTATPAVSTHAGTLASNLNTTNRNIDAAVISTRLFVAYNYTTTGISIKYLDSSFAASSELHNTSHDASGAISIWGAASNNVWISYSDMTNVYMAAYDFNLSSTIIAPFTFDAKANVNQITGTEQRGASPETGMILYCAYTNHSTNNLIRYGTFVTGGGGELSVWLRSASLASKLFYYSGNYFALALYGGAVSGQPTLFLCMLNRDAQSDLNVFMGAVVAKIAPSLAFDASRVSLLPEVSSVSTGIYQIAYGQAGGGAEIPEYGTTWAATFDFTVTPQSAEIASTLHMTGGQLWMYDGSHVCEHGFHLYPDNMSKSITATGSMVQGTYQYIAVFEWLDGQGQLHRSAPSLPLTAVVAGGGAASIAVTVSTLRVTLKCHSNNPVQVVLYRTAPDGTIFYYIGKANNDITADTVTITDTTVDNTGNVELYTTGGQVENSSAPPCIALATYKSRLIVIPSDNPYSWWFSQQVIPSSASSSATPVELSAFFVQNIDQNGGAITGVGVMDDKLVLMKKDLPYYVVGDGPAPNGTSNDYSPPQRVTSPVGSVNAASVVMTPMGLMFQAANGSGIWLLDRSLTASYLGADVEAYNGQTVTSAVLYALYNQVRFTMSGGVTLSYDYYVHQWTVSTGISAVQAALFQGSWTYVKSSGQVLQESSSVFTNNGAFVQLKIGTSWLQFAGLQGFQRVYEALILGEYESAHTLNANVYYDFDPAVAQTTAITPTATPPYQWRLLFNRQKCEAMKIELYDSQISPAEGVRLSAISLKVGVKGGLNRMPAARTFE